jgi:diguanylate cyclase (GGDEF)-like protein/PAS domain S-box-containing protein
MRASPFDETTLGDLGLAGTAAGRTGSRNAHRLAVEHAVAQCLSYAADLNEAADALVQLICEQLGGTCGTCWIADVDGTTLRRVGAWGEADASVMAFLDAVPTMHRPDRTGGLLCQAWRKGEPVAVCNLSALRSHQSSMLARSAGMVSAFAFPITCAGQVLGAVEVHVRDVADLDAAWLDCLRHIGGQIGQFHQRALAQARLRESEKRFADTVELAAIGIAHVDEHGRLIQVNRSLCDLLGYGRDELLGMTVKQVSHPDDLHVTDGVRAQLRCGKIGSFQAEKRYLRKDGQVVWVHLTISLLRDPLGQPLHDIAIIQDISARKRAEAAQNLSEQRFRNMVELSSDWYWELDATLRFTTFGGRGTGERQAAQLIGRHAWDIPGTDRDQGWRELRERLERHERLRDFEYAYATRDGVRHHVSASGEPLFDTDGRFAGYRGVSRDVSERKQAEERVKYLATHDSLTGLPNRAMFSELLNHVIQHSRRKQTRCAVFFIDLDRFKFINDSLGHGAGDTLLRTVAQRLKDRLRSSDIVARLGGDEFVMLAQDLSSSSQAAHIARKVLSAVIQPVELFGQECRVTASVGIAMYPDDATDETTLMAHADVAMYHAKEEGKNNFQFYDGRLQTQSRERLAMESHLRRAIELGEFSLHYQAKLDFATLGISGVEALLRWHNAELGHVSPAKFIPLAEETGLIMSIGRWVLQTACAQAVAWQRAGLPPVRVAVNLSPRQLADAGLVAEVRRVLDDSGLAPRYLELEVTESSVMHNVELALEVLTGLHEMGVHLAIDDFGTGYSSLAQLKRFPIDTLKVDRSFIRELPHDAEDMAIAEAILAMGRTLGMRVVAEGVETAAQRDFLRERRCDEMQGYLFSKPLPADDFAQFLRDHPAKRV